MMDQPPPPPATIAASRLLLVEDDVDLARALQTALAQDGVALTVARNGREALELIGAGTFDLMLLDLGLPEMDGFELLARLNQESSAQRIPVIVLTARKDTADKLRGFDLGALDYVTKPFELVELRARIRSMLRQQRLQQELIESNHKLETARLAAEENARAKADFVANMSHEIRTPMNGVIAMTGLLMQTELGRDQCDFVETIRTSGESLLTIIDDILNFSKIDSGKMELEERPLDLRGCVEEAVDLLASKAEEKNLELSCHLEFLVPEQVVGDVTRLRQILVNLLGNAIKFTQFGEVFLTVSSQPMPLEQPATPGPDPVVPADRRRYELHFAVRDTGIGIPADRLGRLFHSFSQVDSSVTRQFGGTGLGLAISKGLVELMGGRMWVESTAGEGSTFQFTLPMTAAADEAASPLRQVHPALSGTRLLLVDDSASTRHSLAEQTRRWGMMPSLAHSAQHALDQARSGTAFDLAVIDCNLPGLDGVSLARELRRLPHLQSLRILFLTGLRGRPPIGSIDDASSGTLSKPVKASQLQAALLRIRSGTRHAQEKMQPHSSLDAKMASRLPLRILLTDDNIINQKVAQRLLKQLGYKADIANNGAEAVRAFEAQPYDVIFMDVQMPEMDGLEATRRIRQGEQASAAQHQSRRPVVIIAMTANAMQGDREKCVAAGMDDYLPKPVRPEGLQSILELHGARLVDSAVPHPAGEAGSALPGSASTSTSRPPTALTLMPPPAEGSPLLEAPPVDLDRLNDFSGGNVENFNELVALYIKQTTDQLEQIRDALARQDAEQTSRVAHSCAGASATCGMIAIVPLLRQMEQLGQKHNLAAAAELVPSVEQEFERLKNYLQTHRPIALAG